MARGALGYFDREDPLEAEVYRELREEFLSVAGPGHVDRLREFAFAMIKPDAFASGLAPEILSRLESEGLWAAALRVSKMDPPQIDELYRFVKEKYRDSWWIMPKVFSGREVVAVLLRGDPPGGEESLPTRLRELVGPTTPDAGVEGQIRYDLKGGNRVLNLIHASDDPAAAVREASVFFSMEEIVDGLETEDPAEWSPEEISPDEPRRIRRWDSFHRVKDEAASLLPPGLEAEVSRLLDEEGEIVGEDLPPAREREMLVGVEGRMSSLAESMLRDLEGSAVDLARSPPDPGRKGRRWQAEREAIVASTAIWLLSDEAALAERRDFDVIVLEMESLDVLTDEWDEVIVHSTWAVMPQMMRDLNRVGRPILGSARGHFI